MKVTAILIAASVASASAFSPMMSMGMNTPVRVAMLTRDAHKGGSWVTSLVSALQERLSAVHAVVQVVSVEHTESDSWLLPACGASQCDLIINRVSDAAPPATAKKTAAILHIFELHGIPVINGARCFAIGNNKMLHPQVLSRAGCEVPRSAVVSSLSGDAERFCEAVCEAASALLDNGCAWPLLAKPNSGGFGEGIVPFPGFDELEQWANQESATSKSTDGLTLLQQYLTPRDSSIYRVWFVRGKITAAVSAVRPTSAARSAQFKGGCVGSCSLQARAPTFTAWDPPADVKENVLRAAEIAEADCGSIELLYDSQTGRPIYFDLNMVTTLPERGSPNAVMDPTNLWGQSFDFYGDWADYIVARLPANCCSPQSSRALACSPVSHL